MHGSGVTVARRVRAVAMVVAFVGVLAACGSSGSSGTGEVRAAGADEASAGYLAQVADTTQGSGTARFESTMEATIDMGGSTLTTAGTGEGAYDIPAQRSRQSLHTNVEGQQFDMEIVVDGATVYERAPYLAALNPALADKWLEISFGALPATGGANPSDPTVMLDYLRGAGATVDEVGHETVRGVDTRHLRTTAKMSDILGKVAEERRRKIEESLGDLPGASEAMKMLDLELALDVYIDADNRVRRIAYDADLAPLSGGTAGTMHQSTDFFAFGEPVDIQIPAEGETVDGLEALKAMVPSLPSRSTTTMR